LHNTIHWGAMNTRVPIRFDNTVGFWVKKPRVLILKISTPSREVHRVDIKQNQGVIRTSKWTIRDTVIRK